MKYVIPTIYFIMILLLGPAYEMAGQPRTDSLRELYNTTHVQDTSYVQLCLALANKYEMSNADSLIYFSQRALAASKKLDYKKGLANSYEVLGAGKTMTGKYDSAIYFFNRSIDLSKKYNLKELLASKYSHIGNVYFLTAKYAQAITYYDSAIRFAANNVNTEIEGSANSNLASVYYKMGNYTKALHYYLRGLKIQERLGHTENVAADLANIANVYFRLGKHDQAIAYTDKAMALHEQSGIKERLIGCLTTYAMIYDDKKAYDSSLHYLQQALQIAQEIKNPYLENILNGNIAEVYLKMHDYSKALNLYKTSEQVSGKLGDAEGLAFAQAGIGKVYIATGNTNEGNKYLENALTSMQEMGIPEQALEISGILSGSYEETGNYRKALYYTRLKNDLSDSLKKEKAGKDVQQLLFNYEMEKKQAQIQLLEKDNAITVNKNKYQQLLLIIIAVVLAFTATLAYILYTHLQRSKKATGVITRQKQEIENQAHKLQELNDFKDDTLSLLAHDLRNPVSALTSTVMLLDEKLMAPEDFLGYKQELNGRLQSVSILLDNMLHWAKGQMKGESAPNREKLDIMKKVEKVISVLGDAAYQKNIMIRNNVSHSMYGYADRDHVDIIIRNIVSNAIKFTRDGGNINISAQPEGSYIAIRIADDGVGMTAKKVRELFTTDNMYTSTRGTGGERGTGLGLQLSYDLIRKNDGDIRVVSTIGQGTEFTLLLPAASHTDS